MAKDKIELLVIGGSAGSLAMVLKILPLLKLEMNIALIIIFHRKQTEEATLIEVLSRRTRFTVKEIDDKDELRAGCIYVAPADYHVLVEKQKYLTLDYSEKVNHSRPSIDVTFESASEVYGSKLACLLLSGANADGVEGMIKAKARGARVLVQDPAKAEVPYMPQQAVNSLTVDVLVDEATMAGWLQQEFEIA